MSRKKYKKRFIGDIRRSPTKRIEGIQKKYRFSTKKKKREKSYGVYAQPRQKEIAKVFQ